MRGPYDPERFVPAGVHGMGDDREWDIPTAAEIAADYDREDADDQDVRDHVAGIPHRGGAW